MCMLQMSWWVLQYQAVCNHIVDSFSVTLDNENYYYWLDHRLTGNKYRAIDWTLWFHYHHKPVHWSIYADYKHIVASPDAKYYIKYRNL